MARIKASVRKATEARLRRVAHAATVFIDGDDFVAVPVDPKLNTGDDYQVNHEPFIRVKRTLMKLKRLEAGDVGVTTWRPFGPGQAEQVVPVDIHPLAVRPGNHPIPPAMAEAFAGRTAVHEQAYQGHPMLSVCAPIRNSMEEVVGVVEVSASLEPERFKVDQLDY
ncbi:MAG: hypothetical protein BIFFINMI_03647 [Phycisphaerae bacterium]|nr:hypothetical protein [Phycisphaerae bacterium]